LISLPVAPARSPSTSYSVQLPTGADATATAHRTVALREEQREARAKLEAAGACVRGGAEIMAEKEKKVRGRTAGGMNHEPAAVGR
jgi:hypothetical protein